MSRRTNFGLLLLVAFFLSTSYGCIYHQVVPERINEEDKLLPKLETKNAISVVVQHNGSTEDIRICCDNNPHKYNARLDVLTDAAKTNLENLLKQKNIAVADGAEKILKVSVVKISGKWEGFTLTYKVMIKVQAGDAIPKEYAGSQAVGHQFATNFAVSRAINEALLAMLKDAEVGHYLKD